MSFEALTADPRSELTRLMDFLGVGVESEWLDGASAIPRHDAMAPREGQHMGRDGLRILFMGQVPEAR